MSGHSVRTALAILMISIGCATISAAAVYDSCAAAARHGMILSDGSSSSPPSAPNGTYLIRSLANSSDVALTHCDMGVNGHAYALVSQFGQLSLKLYRCHFWSQSMPQILLKMLPDELTAACPWRLPLCLSPRLAEPLQPVLAASDSIFYATRVISSTARRLLT
jgi:hypothetical protein